MAFVPLRTLTSDKTGGKSRKVLYDMYVSWMETNFKKLTPVNYTSFKATLSEILNSVFQVPLDPITGNHFIVNKGKFAENDVEWEAEFVYRLGSNEHSQLGLKVQIPVKAVALSTYYVRGIDNSSSSETLFEILQIKYKNINNRLEGFKKEFETLVSHEQENSLIKKTNC